MVNHVGWAKRSAWMEDKSIVGVEGAGAGAGAAGRKERF